MYLTAFHAIDAGPAQLLVTAVDKTGTVLATMQLTVIPGLVRSGATRLIVDAVRVHERLRGNELGSEMMNRTVAEGRRRNGALV
ncbi:GNAT family N-acetyltransferase [Glutamicibacter arilaitensis]|uniref:GNAT family N-acetyltransferase n=1 Tax=Glutamicibacter arilaitensis TaxID=256701 RepID=UPI003FD4F079